MGMLKSKSLTPVAVGSCEARPRNFCLLPRGGSARCVWLADRAARQLMTASVFTSLPVERGMELFPKTAEGSSLLAAVCRESHSFSGVGERCSGRSWRRL